MHTTPIVLHSQHVVLPCPPDSLEVKPAWVLLQGDTIAHVTLDPKDPKLPPKEDATWVDLGDHLLSPSFVNAHTHLSMTCFRGLGHALSAKENLVEDFFFHVEEKMTPQDIASFALIGAYESLLQGVGLVWDHYYHAEAIAPVLAKTSLCAVLSPTLQDLSGPGATLHKGHWEQTLSLTQDRWQKQGIWTALGPHATDTVSTPLLKQIASLARDQNLPIHLHVAQSIEEYQRAWDTHQCSPVAYLERIGLLDTPHVSLVHMLFATSQDLKLLDPKHHVLGFCPVAQMLFDFPARADLWSEHDIPWFVATDSPASNDSLNLQKELRHVSSLRTSRIPLGNSYHQFFHHGAPAQHVRDSRVALATSLEELADPASLLAHVWSIPGEMHPAFTAGSISPGALANLAVWDLEHPSFWPGTDPLRSLAFGDVTPALWGMISRGSWVGRTGDFARSLTQSDAYKEAQREAKARFDSLVARL